MSLATSSGDHAMVELLSDGSASVSFRDEEGLGAEVGVGADVAITGGGRPAGAGLRAEASQMLELATGRSYEFDSAARAVSFVRRYASHETLGGEARNRALSVCPGCRAMGAEPTALPAPDASFLEGGGSTRAELDARLGPSGLGIDTLVEAAIGRRVDHRNGDRTYYYRVGGEGSAA